MQRKVIGFVLMLLVFFNLPLMAQWDKPIPLRTFRVGIFAPLYLDSVFNGSYYKYSRNFPRFTVQGLDFVQGAQIALDSLPFFGGNVNADIYDTKSISKNIDSLILNKKLDSLDLMIGSVKDEDFLKLSNLELT